MVLDLTISNNFSSIEQMSEQLYTANKPNTIHKKEEKTSFERILKEKQELSHKDSTIRFSKHASERLLSRNIDLSKAQLERLSSAANKAREKGMKESLVMIDNLAFIVNIKNNTVVTAIKDTEEAVFTNIDGAVII